MWFSTVRWFREICFAAYLFSYDIMKENHTKEVSMRRLLLFFLLFPTLVTAAEPMRFV